MVKSTQLFGWENEPSQERAAFPSGNWPRSGTHARGAPSEPWATGKLKREPHKEQDLVLSALAQEWTLGLPAALRPVQLNEKYPRISNRLALCWPDKALAKLVLDDLVHDKRPGRRGFAEAIKRELRLLHHAVMQSFDPRLGK